MADDRLALVCVRCGRYVSLFGTLGDLAGSKPGVPDAITAMVANENDDYHRLDCWPDYIPHDLSNHPFALMSEMEYREFLDRTGFDDWRFRSTPPPRPT